jgi:hypothetical protein
MLAAPAHAQGNGWQHLICQANVPAKNCQGALIVFSLSAGEALGRMAASQRNALNNKRDAVGQDPALLGDDRLAGMKLGDHVARSIDSALSAREKLSG